MIIGQHCGNFENLIFWKTIKPLVKKSKAFKKIHRGKMQKNFIFSLLSILCFTFVVFASTSNDTKIGMSSMTELDSDIIMIDESTFNQAEKEKKFFEKLARNAGDFLFGVSVYLGGDQVGFFKRTIRRFTGAIQPPIVQSRTPKRGVRGHLEIALDDETDTLKTSIIQAVANPKRFRLCTDSKP